MIKVRCTKDVYADYTNILNVVEDISVVLDAPIQRCFTEGTVYECQPKATDYWVAKDDTQAEHIIKKEEKDAWFYEHFVLIDAP